MDLAPGEWREYVNNRLWLDSAKRVISRHEAGEPWPKWARPVEELEAEVADMELHLLEQREKRPEMYNRFEWEYVEAQNP